MKFAEGIRQRSKQMQTDDLPQVRGRSALIVFFCWLAALGEGIDLQAPGVTLPVLTPLFQLSDASGEGVLGGLLGTRGLFLSMSTLGMLIGAIVGGRLSDVLGRKWIMVASVALLSLFTVLTAHSTSTEMLLWMRFLTGLGLGGCYANMLALAVEYVSLKRRFLVVTLLHSAMPTGGALISLAAYSWATPELWRNIYYLGAAVPLLAGLGVVFGVPDLRPQRPARKEASSVRSALFGDGRRYGTALLWMAFFVGMMIQYILLSWLPSLLVANGLPKDQASLAQLSYNLLSAPGSLLAGFLIARGSPSRRVPWIFASAIGALVLIAVAPVSTVFSMTAAGLVGLTVSGSMATMFAFAPGIYPAHARGTGFGLALAVGRVGAIVSPLLVSAMVASGASSSEVLGVMAPLMLMGGFAVWQIARSYPQERQPALADS